MLYVLDQITRRKVFSCFSLYAWRNFWNSHGHSLWILMPITIVSRLPIFISLSPSHPHILLPNQPRSFPSGSDTLSHCFQISHGHSPQYTLLPDQPCYALSSSLATCMVYYHHGLCGDRKAVGTACWLPGCILFKHDWHLRFNPVGKDS